MYSRLREVVLSAVMILLVPLSAVSEPLRPLTIKAQGSFFVGGEKKGVQQPATAIMPAQSGDITVSQMYVQYQIPIRGERHVPVVMVHGCCLSSKTWETTPDGRIGWSEYFVRHDRSVYLAEQVSRARSGFDPTVFYEIYLGKKPASQMPRIDGLTHQNAWLAFRFGPKFGETFSNQQFPMHAIDEFYKQLIPDLTATLPQDGNPTWTGLAALGAKLGGVVLMGHSQSGFFPERAALVDPNGIKGIVSIETECETGLTPAQIAVLATIPTLIMFGDHLEDVVITLTSGHWTWANALGSCKRFVEQLKKAGGDAEVMYLPALGIRGNSHMLMQDRNSDELAQLVLAWIERRVKSSLLSPRR